MADWKMSVTCYVDLFVVDADGKCHWKRRPIESFTLTAQDLDGHEVKTPEPLQSWVEEQLGLFPEYTKAVAEFHYNEFERLPMALARFRTIIRSTLW